jgi:hypothetical protein
VRRLAVLVLLVVLVSAACGREPAFPDRVARVTLGGRTTTYELDACGLDGVTAFLAGRAEDGSVLQATVGVEGDGETGVPDSTGITVYDADAGDWAAFGEESWARRGEAGAAPGSIDSARIRGARIQAGGEAVPVDQDDQPTGGTSVSISLDARCDAEDGE